LDATTDKQTEQRDQICRIDTHYAQCLRAICATQGISVKDMSGAAISREYAKLIVREEKYRQRMKLGLRTVKVSE
jgi:hypothetical protein